MKQIIILIIAILLIAADIPMLWARIKLKTKSNPH